MKYLLVIIFIIGSFSYNFAQRSRPIMDNFISETKAQLTFGQSSEAPNFLRMKPKEALRLKGSDLLGKTNSFLNDYPFIYDVSSPSDELKFKEEIIDNVGLKHIHRVQFHKDVQVYDGQLNFHFDNEENLTSVNGNYITPIKVNPTPTLSQEEAESIALKEVEKITNGIYEAPLFIFKNSLFIFNDGLAKSQKGTNYLVYEIEIRNDKDVREFLFVDAHDGHIVEHYRGICDALGRILYESNTSNQIWEEGDALPGGLGQWQQNEIIAAGHAYHFFNNAFGYESYDGVGAEMRTINNNPNINCPNANWNGVTANYCTGTASDDVVAHEWGHAYTEYTNNLIYAWQAGALNESYSDIWGETIDLLNGYEDNGEDLSSRSGCNSSARWRMGEDASAFGGAIRDMWDPTCNNHPGKVSDSDYRCGTGDSGGVHSNSGVPNHCYALLVDGGTYNGQTINAIGFTKAAHIFWRVQSVYLTKTSDFRVFADALRSACTDLIGVDLEGLSTTASAAGPSGEVITLTDCQSVEAAILAVELDNIPTQCNFTPLLATAPDLCAGAVPSNAIFYENWEAGIGGWTVEQVPVNPGTWDPRDWQISSNLPSGRAGNGMFGVDPVSGDCNTDLDNGVIRLQSPLISIPASSTGPILMTYDHYLSMENLWDGGNVKYKLNGGAWTLLPNSAYTANGYNGSLNTAGAGNDNPMAGQTAFTGSDGGSVSGTWGQSQLDLSTINLSPGDNIQFRWELGSDGCNGWDGWYLDEVNVYSCTFSALPIELSFFNAKVLKNRVALKWQTISEINSDYFIIERSNNGTHWNEISKVPASNNSNEVLDYTAIDKNPLNGKGYYRLKQYGTDGKYEYSKIVNVDINLRSIDQFSVFPNPVSDVLMISSYDNSVISDIVIYDGLGRKIKTVESLNNDRNYSIDVKNWSPGMYTLKIKDDLERFYFKHVVR